MKSYGKRAVLIHIIGFIIARAVFAGMNPLAIGYFAAAYLDKTGSVFIFIAVLLGIASAMSTTQVLKLLLIMIISVVIWEIPILKKKNISKPVLYILPSVLLGMFSLLELSVGDFYPQYIALAILEAVIAYVSAGIFFKGLNFLLWSKTGNRMSNEQMISMAFIVATVIYAFPYYTGAYIAPLETVVFFMVLFFTYKYGIGQGAVIGAVCGFALCLRGGSIADVGLLTMMGIIPAVFRDMGRLPTATVSMVTAAVMGMYYDGMALSIDKVGALTSAVLIFMLLPKNLIYKVDTDVMELGGGISHSVMWIAKNKMRIFSDSFLKLSKTLESITDKQAKVKQQETNRIFEEISEKLCRNCNNCNSCWENNFNETYQSACKLFEAAEKNGVICKEDIPPHFLNSCICADQFISETNRGFEIAKLNHIWHNRLAESREVIAEELKELSKVMQEITGDIYSSAQISRMQEEKVLKRLKAARIDCKEINIIERSDKRKEVYLTAAGRYGNCITAKEAATLIGDALNIRFRVSEASKMVISKDYEKFIFIEETNFKVLTGIARVMKENVSGDNFSIIKLETGEMMIALSDGMGTGVEAGEESEAVMSLLEQLMEAGFKPETAIKLINSSLVLKANQQTFSTIDMSVINLYTGICEFIKIGAASAFIKRDNWVETISSTTLPIGMFGSVDYDAVTKKLYEGDIVIMVTDGVLDCIKQENKEAYMENLLIGIHSSNPQEIANKILDRTLSQCDYVPMDDMTVITAGIWLK